MNKVYIVTCGEYSDYGIAAVYSTEEQAYEYVDCNGTDFRVEEYDIDTTVEKKERIWEVFINTETYSVLRCESGIYGPAMKDIIRLYEVYGKGSVPYMALYIQCDTVKRACKIASERLMQVKSNPVFYERVFNKYPDKYGILVFKSVVYGTGEFAGPLLDITVP